MKALPAPYRRPIGPIERAMLEALEKPGVLESFRKPNPLLVVLFKQYKGPITPMPSPDIHATNGYRMFPVVFTFMSELAIRYARQRLGMGEDSTKIIAHNPDEIYAHVTGFIVEQDC